MKLEIAELLVDANPELRLSEEYSGRGMYGKTTTGVVGCMSDLFKAIAIVAPYVNNHEEFVLAMSHLGSDSMGYDTIFY